MHSQEDLRRKPISIKHVPSTHTILSKSITKTIHSKQKQNQQTKLKSVQDTQPKKFTLPANRHTPTHVAIKYPAQQQLQTKKTSGITFCTIKQANQIKRNPVQSNQIVVTQPEHQAISINVNIQNMISAKKGYRRSPTDHQIRPILKKSNERNKSKNKNQITQQIKKNVSLMAQFECDQQLQFTKTSRINNNVNDEGNKNANMTSSPMQINLQRKTSDQQNKKLALFKTDVPLLQKPKLSIQQQLKQFSQREQQINIEAQSYSLLQIDTILQQYAVDPAYIQKKQKNLTWKMRAQLMDWMMQVHFQYSLKRDTFHISIVLADNFMAKQSTLLRSEFQLVGAACMFIASKLQEFEPIPSAMFAKATNDFYTALQVRQMEQKICKVLKFKLNPPTVYTWANRIMTQWDNYFDAQTSSSWHPLFSEQKKQFCYFKKPSEGSYRNFRQAMQLIDCSCLDIQSVQYRPQLLVVSFLYLVAGKQLNGFTNKQITTQFPRSSLYLLNQEDLFNSYFRQFVFDSFGFHLLDLLPTVQYAATYFMLPIVIQKPIIKDEQLIANMNMQEYCSFQDYNSNMLIAIKKRHRGIYQ